MLLTPNKRSPCPIHNQWIDSAPCWSLKVIKELNNNNQLCNGKFIVYRLYVNDVLCGRLNGGVLYKKEMVDSNIFCE